MIPAKATPKTDQEKPKPIAAPTKKTSNTKSEKSFWDKAWEFIKSFDDGSRLGT